MPGNDAWSRAEAEPPTTALPAQASPPAAEQAATGQPETPQVPGQPGDAAPSAPRKRAAKSSNRSLLRELPILIVVALVIAMVIKTFVVQAFVIPTGSMQNTLALYDKILVNKLVYHFRPIHSGDVVVFDGSGSWNAATPTTPASSDPLVRAYDDTLRKLFDSVGGLFGTPIGQTDYVKRVIGVPGDHVVCCNAQGLITINGVAVHEQSYLYPGDSPGSHPAGIPGHFNVTVPPGYLWVLGDHRGISDDSRGHEMDPGNGMIPESSVIGRAFVIVWPPSQWRILPIPKTFKQPGVVPVHKSAAGPVRAKSVAALAPARAEAAAAAAAPAFPPAPYAPAAGGLAGALPLTWLRRRWLVRRAAGRAAGRGQ